MGFRASFASVAATLVLLSSAEAFTQELRFSATRPGNVVATGNTLGLSKLLAGNGPGTADAIGTFLTLDAASSDLIPIGIPAWGPGTTSDWRLNGSSAVLQIPAEAEILYAELIWGGSFRYNLEDVAANRDEPVKLSFGGGAPTDVSPDAATHFDVDAFLPGGNFTAAYYVRSADVTAFVSANRGGTYSVARVPGTQNELNLATNAAGWTLVAAYRFDDEPIRNMAIFVGADTFVDELSEVDFTVDGFCAPPSGEVTGSFAVSALEGDANRPGDELLIGQTAVGPFVTLSGPNNPVDNFFCSQLNGTDGLVDTQGTAGSANHNPFGTALTANVAGGRQGWDITHIALSSTQNQLFPGQTSAVLRTSTDEDSYWPTLAAFAIDVNAPKFLYDQSTTAVDKNSVFVGDTFTLTARIVNTGKAPANDVAFKLELPPGVSLGGFTTNGAMGDVNMMPVTLAALGTGVDMGDVGVSDSREVAVTLVVEQTVTADIVMKPLWEYSYLECANGQPVDEVFKAPIVDVDFEGTMTASGGAGGEGGGTTSLSGGADSGGSGGANGEAFPQGGGFCAVGHGESHAMLGLGLFAALAISRRRAARRAS